MGDNCKPFDPETWCEGKWRKDVQWLHDKISEEDPNNSTNPRWKALTMGYNVLRNAFDADKSCEEHRKVLRQCDKSASKFATSRKSQTNKIKKTPEAKEVCGG